MTGHGLTPKQMKVWECMVAYLKRHGYPPTLDEVAFELGISKVTAFEHIQLIEKKGRVVKTGANRSRCYTPISGDDCDHLCKLIAKIIDDRTLTSNEKIGRITGALA